MTDELPAPVLAHVAGVPLLCALCSTQCEALYVEWHDDVEGPADIARCPGCGFEPVVSRRPDELRPTA